MTRARSRAPCAARDRPRLRLPLDVRPARPAGTCKYHPSCSRVRDRTRSASTASARARRMAGWRLAALQPVVARRSRLPVMRRSSIFRSSRRSRTCPLSSFSTASTTTSGSPGPGRSSRTTIVVRIAARAAHRAADPLDAVAAEARAGDEGDPAEVQGRPAEAERGADEVLQGEPHQPGRVVPAARSRSSRSSSRSTSSSSTSRSTSRRAPTSRGCTSSRTSPTRPTRTGPATCCSPSTPASQIARPTSCRRRWTRRSGPIMMVLPLVFITVVAHFPIGPRHLLGDDEPVDGRPGPRHPAARAEDRRPAADGARSARRGRRRRPTARRRQRRDGEPRRSRSRSAKPRRAAQPRRVKRKKGGTAGGERAQVRSRRPGETVGEAKWKALRELERLAPASTRPRFSFQVVSEGERGLLGVGYTPARVVATRRRGRRRRRQPPPRPTRARPAGASARAGRARRRGDGRPLQASSRRDGRRRSSPPASGDDLGLLIGKHGQTIDAVQVLANAIVGRRRGERQGGRRRRRRLPRPPPPDARGARAAQRRGGAARRAAGRARADERRSSARSCTSALKDVDGRRRRRARGRSRIATSSSSLPEPARGLARAPSSRRRG